MEEYSSWLVGGHGASILIYISGTTVLLLITAKFVYKKQEWQDLAKLKSLGLPIVGQGPNIDVSRALDEAMEKVSTQVRSQLSVRVGSNAI